MAALTARTGPHVPMDPHERALRAVVRRLLAQGVDLEPEHVRWWGSLLRDWPTPLDDEPATLEAVGVPRTLAA